MLLFVRGNSHTRGNIWKFSVEGLQSCETKRGETQDARAASPAQQDDASARLSPWHRGFTQRVVIAHTHTALAYRMPRILCADSLRTHPQENCIAYDILPCRSSAHARNRPERVDTPVDTVHTQETDLRVLIRLLIRCWVARLLAVRTVASICWCTGWGSIPGPSTPPCIAALHPSTKHQAPSRHTPDAL